MFLFWIMLSVLITRVCQGESKDLPLRVKHLLRYVNDFRSLIRAFNMDERFLQVSLPSHERNFGDRVRVLENEVCKPRPYVVEIPQPADRNKFYYPYSVTLYRCAGSCGANPFGTKCVSSVNVTVQVRVADISWEGPHENVNVMPKITHIPFHNETQCQCRCKYDSSVCNRFQYWDEAHCKCKCSGLCTGNFVRHPSECCKCISSKRCTHKKKVWSWKSCSCECKRKKPCKVTRKIRDPRTCRCRCPLIICRYGSVLDEKTCKCTVRNN